MTHDGGDRSLVGSLRAVAREHVAFLVVVGAYTLAWYPVSFFLGLEPVPVHGTGSYLRDLAHNFLHDLLPIALLSYLLAYLLTRGRRKGLNPLALFRDFRSRYLGLRPLGGFALVFLVIPLFLSHFRRWKTAIPQIHPFQWDERFMALDRALHGGHHPWELLQPFLGIPSRTLFIDGVYFGWFEVQFAVLLWMAISVRRFTRARFFLTYALVYIVVGTVAATALSSAGPAFFSQVVGFPDPFAPLMTYLHQVSNVEFLFALDIQQSLWAGFVGGANSLSWGISAMPSVHVAVSVLYVFMGFSIHRLAGWAFLAYALLIFLGSIHLGWHYAIDGYVAALLVWFLWSGVGAVLRRYGSGWGLDPGRDALS